MRVWENLTYQEMYAFIGMDEVYAEAKKEEELALNYSDSEKQQRLKAQYDQLQFDVSRTDVVNEENDPMPVTNAWLSAGGQVDINYSQADSGSFTQLFNQTLIIKEQIYIEDNSTDSIHFNYQSADGRLCNFSLLYQTEKLDHWLLVILVNANRPEAEKKAFVGVSGFHGKLFNRPVGQEEPKPVIDIDKKIQEHINSPAIFNLVRHMFSRPLKEGVEALRCISPVFKTALCNATSEGAPGSLDGRVLSVCRVATPERILEFLLKSDADVKKNKGLGKVITKGDMQLPSSIYLADTDRAYKLLCQGHRLSGNFNFENIYTKTVNHLVTCFSYLYRLVDDASEATNYAALEDFITTVFLNTSESEYGFVQKMISQILSSEESFFEFMPQASYSALREFLGASLASRNIFYDNGANSLGGVDIESFCKTINATVSFGPFANTMVVDSDQNVLMRTYNPTYEEAFTLIKCGNLYSPGGGDYKKDVKTDLPRERFVDEYHNPDFFTCAWNEAASKPDLNYCQGDMRGGPFPECFYTCGLEANGEPLVDSKNKGGIGFGYCDSSGQICGLNLIYKKDNPGQWMLSVMRNANRPDAERKVWVNVFAWDERYFEPPQRQENPIVVDDLYAEIKKQINAPTIFELFKQMIVAPDFHANEAFLLKFKAAFTCSLEQQVKPSSGVARVVLKPSQLLQKSSPSIWSGRVVLVDLNDNPFEGMTFN